MKNEFASIIDIVKHNSKLVAAEDYELVCQRRESFFKHFKNGEQVEEAKNCLWWVQLRVVQRKSLGVASTVFIDETELSNMVDRALALVGNTSVDPWFRFPLWRPQGIFGPDGSEELGSNFSFDQIFLQSLYPNLLEVPVALEEKYTHQNEERVIARKTEKMVRQSSAELKKFHFGVVNESRSGFYQIEETRGYSKPFKTKESFLERLLSKSKRLSDSQLAGVAPSGRYILSGQVVAVLLKTLSPDFSGGEVARGKSRFSNQLSDQIFSDQVSIIDHGLFPGGEGSQSFDLEGSLGQETILIDRGVLKTFLHDASTGARFNRTSTANLVFTESKIPSLGATNLYLKPSATSLFALFKSMGDGFYLESLEKVGRELTQDGKLELVGHGWRVKDGDPVEAVTKIFFKLDPIEIFKEIKMVSDDLDFWGRYGAPSVFLEKMPLSDV